jgi:hypothetical protein
MKNFITIVFLSFGTLSFTNLSSVLTEKTYLESQLVILETQFQKGFKDGHCEGWKDVKGDYAICPIAPIAPIPKIGQKSTSYKDGYNTGFKRGMKDARK